MNRRAAGAGRLRPRTRPTDNHEVIVRALSVAVSAAVLAFGLGEEPNRSLDCGGGLGLLGVAPGSEVWAFAGPGNVTDDPVELVSVEPASLPAGVEWLGVRVYDSADSVGAFGGWRSDLPSFTRELMATPSAPVTSWTLPPADDDTDGRYLLTRFRIADDARPGTYELGDLRFVYTVDGRQGEQEMTCDFFVQVAAG